MSIKTIILLCTFSLILTNKPFLISEEFIEANYEYLFNDFITEHNKDYSEEEHILRLKIFKNNLYTIKNLQ